MKLDYSPVYIKQLFDEMAGTYGIVNLVSSFGFAALWRRQCLNRIQLPRNAHVLDLMTGMGELIPGIAKRGGHVTAIDISPRMCDKARSRNSNYPCRVIETDVFENKLPDESADAIVSSFGLKTLSEPQMDRLAGEIKRLLRPGGVFSLIEISVPYSWALCDLYMFYINSIIPLIGKLFLGNPDNYRMLGIYTEEFWNCRIMYRALKENTLKANYEEMFFGCASCVWGSK